VTYPIARRGIFWTLQGEGALQGEPMAFVRLAGCSIGCPQCDTDYRVDRRLSVEAIVAEVKAIVPPSFSRPWVWITGGEPTDHDLVPLCLACDDHNWRVAVATAGTRALDRNFLEMVSWLSVSPHAIDSSCMQRYGHEVKIVPGLNGLSLPEAAEEVSNWSFPHKFLMPIWWATVNGPESDGAASRASMVACREFVLSHPGWRLTTQAHKQWELP
jgi:organic radical activating enzyme